MVTKIIKYSAEWCFPCKMFHPIFHEVSLMGEFKNIVFEEADVDDDNSINMNRIMKYGIRSVPTTVFLDENNELINKISGVMSKGQFIEAIKTLNQ